MCGKEAHKILTDSRPLFLTYRKRLGFADLQLAMFFGDIYNKLQQNHINLNRVLTKGGLKILVNQVYWYIG